MNNMAINDFSQASANAMLTAQTSKVISRLMRGSDLDDRSRTVVESAAAFLTGIVEGSLLVENRQVAGFAPSHESLREYVRALSALQDLDFVSVESGGDMFVAYQSQLVDLAQHRAVALGDLQHLRQFFDALSAVFFSDLTRPESEVHDRKHQSIDL